MESECTFMFKWTFLWISGQISGRESADRTVRSLSPITMQGPHLTCVPTAQQRTSYQAVTSYLPKEWKRKKLIGPINSTKPGLRAGKKTDLLSCPKAQVLWRREFQKAPTQDSPYSWEPGVTLGSPGHFLGHHLSLSIFWNGLVHFPGCTHLTLYDSEDTGTSRRDLGHVSEHQFSLLIGSVGDYAEPASTPRGHQAGSSSPQHVQ